MPVPPPLCVPILMKCYASAVVFHLEIEKEHCLAGAVEGENISEQARKFKKSLELLLCNLSPCASVAITPFQNRKRSPYKARSLFKLLC